MDSRPLSEEMEGEREGLSSRNLEYNTGSREGFLVSSPSKMGYVDLVFRRYRGAALMERIKIQTEWQRGRGEWERRLRCGLKKEGRTRLSPRSRRESSRVSDHQMEGRSRGCQRNSRELLLPCDLKEHSRLLVAPPPPLLWLDHGSPMTHGTGSLSSASPLVLSPGFRPPLPISGHFGRNGRVCSVIFGASYCVQSSLLLNGQPSDLPLSPFSAIQNCSSKQLPFIYLRSLLFFTSNKCNSVSFLIFSSFDVF